VKTDTGDHPDRTWEEGWGGHERAQLRRLADLSLIEKLRWLEEAHDLVRQLSISDQPSTRASQV
jgi:hypothetical protein